MTTMKKREYIKPSIQVEDLLEHSMICASIVIDDEEINTGGRVRGKRGSWGDLWDGNNPQDNYPSD